MLLFFIIFRLGPKEQLNQNKAMSLTGPAPVPQGHRAPLCPRHHRYVRPLLQHPEGGLGGGREEGPRVQTIVRVAAQNI